MSPRAAWRLERLGFSPVYDYVAGKVDWMAAGLPTVRADATERRALDAVDPNPATCAPNTPARSLPAGEEVIVVNHERIVLGRVRAGAQPPDATAEDVMTPGPTTVRANEPLDPLLERMSDKDVPTMIVTTPEGRLLGVIHRS
jgi:CBS domain-containing protein